VTPQEALNIFVAERDRLADEGVRGRDKRELGAMGAVLAAVGREGEMHRQAWLSELARAEGEGQRAAGEREAGDVLLGACEAILANATTGQLGAPLQLSELDAMRLRDAVRLAKARLEEAERDAAFCRSAQSEAMRRRERATCAATPTRSSSALTSRTASPSLACWRCGSGPSTGASPQLPVPPQESAPGRSPLAPG